MQSISGTHLADTWNAVQTTPAVRVLVDWSGTGGWVDESERVLSLRIMHSLYNEALGLPHIGDGAQSYSTALVTFDNTGYRYSPNNSSGLASTYPNLADGIYRVPIRIDAGYEYAGTPEYVRQFTGEIEDPSEDEAHGMKQVSMSCVGQEVAVMQHKFYSALYENERADAIIDAYLTEAGITGGARVLDVANTVIPWAWTDGENLWDECMQVAQADGGFLFVSKLGVFTFRRGTSLAERSDSTTPCVELTSGNATAYRDKLSWRNCYSGVVVEYAGRYLGPADVVYTAPRQIVVPASGSVTEKCRLRLPVVGLYAPEAGTDYQAVTAGMDEHTGVTVSTSEAAQHVEVTFANAHATLDAYILSFQLRGTPLLGDEAQEAEYETTLTPAKVPDTKVYRLSGNPYIQTREQAEVLGGYLRDRLQRPRRIYEWSGPLCPWLEVLDRVTLDRTVVTPNPGVDQDCWILGESISWRNGQMLTQTLRLLPADDVYAADDLFIFGSSAWANSGSDKVGY